MSTPVLLVVNGLFGEFDHVVEFPVDDEFAIIYGPNGIGKTKFMEVIVALSRLSITSLNRLPFRSARLRYSDGADIRLQKSEGSQLLFNLTDSQGEEHEWPCNADEFIHSNSAFVAGSEWIQVGPGVWQDQSDGETITENEFRSRYEVPTPNAVTVPQALVQFQQTRRTYLIETQRLLADRSERYIRTSHLRRVPRRPEANEKAVARYADDIVSRLREALTANSRNSAALDRTFPQRLLDMASIPDVSEEEIRSRYQTQNQKRERLARFSLIASEPDFGLPSRDLEAWERGVLWLYLQDTEGKLSTFDPILEKVELFEEIINKRFLRKRVRVDAEAGLVITSTQGVSIAPDDLSSGEQHELIMFYDLLFSVPAGALVLIDEPEISLHVAWQRGFLDDMLRVSQLSRARIMVATHSPQIIGKWHSRTTQLGPSMHDEWDG